MRAIPVILGILLLCMVLPQPPELCAGCATSSTQGAPYSNNTWVVVGYSSGLSSYASSIQSGMNMWNSGCSGASGCKYPGLGFSTEFATYESNLSIDYQSGHAASLGCAGGTQYCRGTWNASTLTMTIYDQAGPPSALVSFSSLDDATRSSVFAHEFGHALGLGDDNCSGGIMNGVFNSSSTLNSDECAMADSSNHVPWEGTTNEGCISLADCRQSPIVIDVDHNGYQLSGLDDPVLFDIDGDGHLDRMAWTARGADDAFLFQDFNGNGIADNGPELYGTAMAKNGFEGLRRGDLRDEGDLVAGGNGDGVIDASDQLWSRLLLWVDADHDGISRPDEVFTPAEKGLVSIGLGYKWSGHKDSHGNELRYGSPIKIRNKQGHEIGGRAYDVFFSVATH